jgi:hypothetical protein
MLLEQTRRLDHHMIVQRAAEELNSKRKFFAAEPARDTERR